MRRNRSVSLPFHPDPGFSTECYHQLRLSILMTNERTLPWIYSRFVLLKLHYAMSEQFPMLRFDDHLDVYADILIESALQCEGTWTDTIRSCLEDGDYVLIYLNWKHVPCSNHYQRQDLFHEALIYGFNDEQRRFLLLGFDVNNRLYAEAAIDYDLCEREFVRHMTEDASAQQWFAHYGFPIARLSVKQPHPLAFDYRRLYFGLDRGRVGIDASDTKAFALGYPVHELMSSFFSQISRGRRLDESEHPFWNIMIYKMIQHNRLMQRRLDYLLQTAPTSVLPKIHSYYEANGKALQRIRALSLQVQRTRGKETLQTISDTFRKAFEREKRAVALWMDDLNQQKLKAAAQTPSEYLPNALR